MFTSTGRFGSEVPRPQLLPSSSIRSIYDRLLHVNMYALADFHGGAETEGVGKGEIGIRNTDYLKNRGVS
jgi:hypothetical protein